MNDLGKALDLLKSKKMPIGTVHNGMKKVAEGKWEPVKEGASSGKRVDENTSSHHADEADRHMSEAVKHQETHSKLQAKINARKKIDPNYEVPEAAQKVLDEAKAKSKAHGEDHKDAKSRADDSKSDVEATKQDEAVKESKKKQSEKNKNQKLEEGAQKQDNYSKDQLVAMMEHYDDHYSGLSEDEIADAGRDYNSMSNEELQEEFEQNLGPDSGFQEDNDMKEFLRNAGVSTSQVRSSTDKEEAQAKKDKATKKKQLDDEWGDSKAPGQNKGTGEHSVDWSTVDSHNRRSKEYKAAVADYKDLSDSELKEIATKIGMQMDKEMGPGARGSYEVGARFYPWKTVGKKHALDLIATYNMGSKEIKKGQMQIAMQDHEAHEQYRADKPKEGIEADPRPQLDKGGPGSGRKNQHDKDARTYQLMAQKETDPKKKAELEAKAIAASVRSANLERKLKKGGQGSGKRKASSETKYKAKILKDSYMKWRDHYLAKKDDHSLKMCQMYEKKMRDLVSTLKKSLIQADDQGSAINTSDAVIELNSALKCPYYNKFNETMKGYNYGDAPRTIQLDKGYSIIMSKVDDGLYSGFVRQTIDWDGESPLEETASKVEKQTIPSIISFLKAKEYIQPPMAVVDEPAGDIEPPQALEASDEESFEVPVPAQEMIADRARDEILHDVAKDSSDKALAEKLINLLDRLI